GAGWEATRSPGASLGSHAVERTVSLGSPPWCYLRDGGLGIRSVPPGPEVIEAGGRLPGGPIDQDAWAIGAGRSNRADRDPSLGKRVGRGEGGGQRMITPAG